MIRIADINGNDMVNGEGVSVSLYFQGCPHHCPGCFNPETWSYDGGYEMSKEQLIEIIVNKLIANGINRNLSILGGETLDTPEKIDFLNELFTIIKNLFPTTKIYLWTGYIYEDIKEKNNLQYIFSKIDYLIDGPFILDERDITLKLRGSRNQRIIDMKKTLQDKEVKLYIQ